MKTKNTILRRICGIAFLAPCLLLGLAGCKSIGPGQVPGDRFDYSAAIGDSWKRQTLLNIVKLRYRDPRIFVDAGQIVASRSLSRSINVDGQISSAGALQGNSLLLGGADSYTDQSTVTYTPLTGNKRRFK